MTNFIWHISENFTQGFLVNTKGCRIQELDPFDQSIWHCLYDENPVQCNKDNISRLVKSRNYILYVDTSVLPEYNLTKDNVKCCYRPFWRQELSPEKIETETKLADTSFRYLINSKKNYMRWNTRTTLSYIFRSFMELLNNVVNMQENRTN